MIKLTGMDLLESFGIVNNINELINEYRLLLWDSTKGERYLIEKGTNSGFMFSVTGEVKVYVSGVLYGEYYEVKEKEITLEDDLKKVIKALYVKEPLNKDRFSNLDVFIDELAVRRKMVLGYKESVSSVVDGGDLNE